MIAVMTKWIVHSQNINIFPLFQMTIKFPLKGYTCSLCLLWVSAPLCKWWSWAGWSQRCIPALAFNVSVKFFLNKYLSQMDLTDICRTFHTKESKYVFFSNAHGTFSKIDHMIGHETSLKKFKKIEIISSIFSDHKSLKLETNLKEKTREHSNS